MMSGDTPREPARAERRSRGRPRRVGADERIIEAAIVEFGEQGWSGFTIDKVARRARVGKSTVYLRWADKEALLADAMRANDATLALPPDTGSLRGDLYELTRVLLRRFRDPVGWASYRIFLDAAITENRTGILPPDVRDDYMARGMQIFARAEARGDLTIDASAATLMSVLHGAAIHTLLALRVDSIEVTDEVLDKVAHNITACLVHS
jgi:AcrR family transcriptional regulator